MLVGAFDLDDAIGVVAGLVSEGAVADVGLLRPRGEVGDFADEVADVGEAGELVVRDDVAALLELEAGDDAEHVGVAAALAVAVDAGLDLADAVLEGGEAVGDGDIGVVVAVDAERCAGEGALYAFDGLEELRRQGAAVGVAEHETIDAVVDGGSQAGEGIVGVRREAVEEVLGVEEDLLADGLEEADGVAQHGEVLFVAGLQHGAHMQVVGLADDGDDFGAGVGEDVERGVPGGIDAGAPGRAEGNELRVELDVTHTLEELDVLGVGGGEAAFDVVDAQLVEAAGDAQLVLDGERDAFHLSAIAQRCVVKLRGH